MTGLLLSDDLIFTSRVTATARAHGLTVNRVRTPGELLARAVAESPAAVLLDLHVDGLDVPAVLAAVRANGPVKVIAYGSHVDAERLRAARQAGCDLVMPRSQFVERLEADLPAWLTPTPRG